MAKQELFLSVIIVDSDLIGPATGTMRSLNDFSTENSLKNAESSSSSKKFRALTGAVFYQSALDRSSSSSSSIGSK